MLGKLIKHEFKATYWEFGLMFLAALAVTAMTKIFSVFNSGNKIIEIFSALFTAVYYIAIIGLIVGAVVLIVKRFYVNMVKDEGYLSFTLPVTVSQHILSKVLVSVTWMIATYAVIAVMLCIMLVGVSDEFGSVCDILREISIQISEYGMWWAVIEGIAIVIVGLFCTPLQYYACIAVGQLFGNHKVIGSFAAYFANSMIVQIITSIGVLVLSYIIGMEEMDAMSDIEVMNTYGAVYLHIYLAFIVVITAVYFLITKIVLEKKLNLE